MYFATVALSGDPLLVWNYGVMGVLAFIVGWIFWWSVKDLDRHECRMEGSSDHRLDSDVHRHNKEK